MARQSRTSTEAVDAAVKATSEAARTLQAAGQNKLAEKPETQPKERTEVDPGHMARALKNRDSSKAMDEILAKRGITDEEEPKAEEPKKEEPKAEEPKVEAKVEAKVEPVEEPKAETPTEPVVEAPKMVKVKIDGEESEVSQEEVDAYGGVRGYQIAKASEKRLAEVKELLSEARKTKEAPQEPAKPSVSKQQFIAERMDKIRFGTPEEAATAQMEIMEYGREKAPDQQAIAFQVEQQIANKQAVAKFREEFSDIANNPILWKAAVGLEQEKAIAWQKSGRPVDWLVEYRKIGNEVRSAFGRSHQSASTSTAQSTTSSNAKEEKKAAAVVAIPTAAARAALPKEEKELSPEEERKAWLADTKKARGQ